MKRTSYGGVLTKEDVGHEVVLTGWVHRRRDHGSLIFIDLRDRQGLVQVVFNPQCSDRIHQWAHTLRSEYVIEVHGTVALRPEGTQNPGLPTGDVEILATDLVILNASLTPPFSIEEDKEPSEILRLKYRYLDLRRPSVQRNFILRHQLSKSIRHFLDQHQFLEIETPYLTKSTPEGARDFLVPSRLNAGEFYALPQSPQLFKQILMVSGFDRYYQMVRCFRDEDLRADRQPEFTQVDIEMSFVEQGDVISLMEEMIKTAFLEVAGVQMESPFPRLSYCDAMSRFGVDKPDLRFDMELKEISDLAAESGFGVFRTVTDKKGKVAGINAKGLATLSRKEIEMITQEAIQRGAKGLAWMKVTSGGIESPIAKFFNPNLLDKIRVRLAGCTGDMLLFVADQEKVTNEVLGHLRIVLAQKLRLIDPKIFKPLWVTDFPLLEYDEVEKRYVAKHHPFTAPVEDDLAFLSVDPLRIRAKAYDMVMNGTEIGGGSIRMHQADIQSKMFHLLGIKKEDAELKFGFLLEALQYGAPPHGGIAFGFDRLTAILAGVDSIREVIAFPKTQKGTCLMTDAPSDVEPQQLKDLHIKKNV